MKKLFLILFAIGLVLNAQSQDAGGITPLEQGKLKALDGMRRDFARDLTVRDVQKTPIAVEIDSLMSDGLFSDIREQDIARGDVGDSLLVEAFSRIWHISDVLRENRWALKYNEETWNKCQKAILRYGEIELRRSDTEVPSPSSCCEIPALAVNAYFCQLKLMEKAEQDSLADERLKDVCRMLKKLAFRAWPLPGGDERIDGNAFIKRPLWEVAMMFRSVAMMDWLADTCRKAISSAAQNTVGETLGQDVFTADGLCWAYGRQAWNGERVIKNTFGALGILKKLRGTPWKGMDREQAAILVNYFRGSSFYYYKGYNVPCLGQNTMLYQPERELIGYWELLKILIIDWEDAFSKVDFKELKQLYIEAQGYDPKMYRNPYYAGSRWFFNNDDLIKKTRRYHIAVNMASSRSGSPGGELFSDAYNHFSADGATFFQKTGTEYQKVFGAFDITAFPGVTARVGMKYVLPSTGRAGYCSMHNFAAGATSGGENAAAGFIYEKIPVAERGKKGRRNYYVPEEVVLYGVKAYKSYFILGDYFVALGAGITNKVPHVRRRIRTTIEQAERVDSVYQYKGNGIDWVVHKGKFAYSVFPRYQANAYHVCETKKTFWAKMNPHNQQMDGLPEKVDIFRMWIEHGHNPVNDTYGYVVYAGEGNPSREYPFEVLRNDTLVQAVKSQDNKVIGAVFYDTKTVLHAKGISVSVSAPCAVLVEKLKGYLTLSVTDALMNPDCRRIDVILDNRKITLDMPQGRLCGQPAVYRQRLSD